MIPAFFLFLALIGILALVSAPRSAGSGWIRLSLAAIYVGIIALAANTYQAAMEADQQGLDGSKIGWLGGWGLPALVALILLAIGLHIALARRKPS